MIIRGAIKILVGLRSPIGNGSLEASIQTNRVLEAPKSRRDISLNILVSSDSHPYLQRSKAAFPPRRVLLSRGGGYQGHQHRKQIVERVWIQVALILNPITSKIYLVLKIK